MKSKFKNVSSILLDKWLGGEGKFNNPEVLFSDIIPILNIKMSLNIVYTTSADPLDWIFRSVKRYGFKSTLLNIPALIPDGSLRDMPDQGFISHAIVPHYSKVIETRRPAIDLVRTKITGITLGYDRIVLPDNASAYPAWCVSVTEGRFFVSARREETTEDILDESIMQLIMEGQTAKEAADMLGMSRRTVEHRLEKMKALYEAKNLPHLVAKVMSAHLAKASVK